MIKAQHNKAQHNRAHIVQSSQITLDISESPIDFQRGSWKYPE